MAKCFDWGGQSWGKDFPGWISFRAWLINHGADPNEWIANHIPAAECIGAIATDNPPAPPTAPKAYCFEWDGQFWGKDYPGAVSFMAWLAAHGVSAAQWADNHPDAAVCIGIRDQSPAPAPAPAPSPPPAAPPPAAPGGPVGPIGPQAPATPQTNTPLTGTDFVQALRAAADLSGIDALAAAAVSFTEGMNGGIGDNGTAFGPWQIHLTDGRLPEFSGESPYSVRVQSWAWSQEGIAYAMRSMRSAGAGSRVGVDAIERIVTFFEKPADIPGEIADAIDAYNGLQAKGGSAWAVVAAAADGPSLTTGGGTPAPVPRVVPSEPTARWKDLTWMLSHQWPEAGVHASRTGNSLIDLIV